MNSRAFTVIEVAIAIALIAVGTTIGAAAYSGYQSWAKDTAATFAQAGLSQRDAVAGYDLLTIARHRRASAIEALRRDDIDDAARDIAIRELAAAQTIIDAAAGVR